MVVAGIGKDENEVASENVGRYESSGRWNWLNAADRLHDLADDGIQAVIVEDPVHHYLGPLTTTE